MRKFLFLPLILACFYVCFSPYAYPVNAQDEYLRVITEDTPFYQNLSDDSPLFFLPYTYYVKALGVENDFTYVEVYGQGGVAAIDGFVPTDMLFSDGLSVENPFVILTLTTQSTAVLYADSNLTVPVQYLFANRQLNYYGKLGSENEIVYFVGYNDKLGYVKEDAVFPFSIPNHPNELTFIVPETPQTPPVENLPQSTNDEYLILKICIIACLIFAGVVALFFAIKFRANKSVATSFYDENDYE